MKLLTSLILILSSSITLGQKPPFKGKLKTGSTLPDDNPRELNCNTTGYNKNNLVLPKLFNSETKVSFWGVVRIDETGVGLAFRK
ncbi:MAG: hypothetical protein SFU98_04840 [Leptospiraceae bacterium]|nr:hypothetical protein [Leptospiraceae bacterium]